MRPTRFSVFSRLPGGEKFREMFKSLRSVFYGFSPITRCAFRLSLHHFVCGGKYGILVPNVHCRVPRYLYHVGTNECCEKISAEGIMGTNGVIFASDNIDEMLGYIHWKYGSEVDFEKFDVFTIDTKLCGESGYNFCKLTRGNEFIAERVPPNVIIDHANFAEFLFLNHCDN